MHTPQLIDAERYWRKLKKRDDRECIINFSDLQHYRDGELYNSWDLIDGEIGYGQHSQHPINVFHLNHLFDSSYDRTYPDTLQLCEAANLTSGETPRPSPNLPRMCLQ